MSGATRVVDSITGREVELAELSQWILQERCRLVAVLGMGGIGKSSQDVEMQDATLARAHLHDVVWTSAFDAVISVAVSPDGCFWAAG